MKHNAVAPGLAPRHSQYVANSYRRRVTGKLWRCKGKERTKKQKEKVRRKRKEKYG
jgi:hypothetical protein